MILAGVTGILLCIYLITTICFRLWVNSTITQNKKEHKAIWKRVDEHTRKLEKDRS